VAEQKTIKSIESIPYLIRNRDSSKSLNMGLRRKVKKKKESIGPFTSTLVLPPAALLFYIPIDVLKDCVLSFLNNPLDRLSIQLTCRTFREISDSPEMLRGFNFCTDGGREGNFYHFKTTDRLISDHS